MTLVEGEDVVLFHMTAAIVPDVTRRRGDFMATVWVRGSALQAEFRYRWHNTRTKLDMDGTETDDEKSFYTIGPVEDSAGAREKMIRAFELMPEQTVGLVRPWSERGEWSVAQFMEVMLRSPMMTQMTPMRLEKKP